MTQIYVCPVEGCDYDGPKNSVASHYSGKSDDAHSGGYERAQTLLENQAPDDTVEDESPDAGSDDGGDSPGGGLQFPENPDADTDDGCPNCGQPMTAVPEGQLFETEDGRRGRTEGTEQHCERCGVLVEPPESLIDVGLLDASLLREVAG